MLFGLVRAIIKIIVKGGGEMVAKKKTATVAKKAGGKSGKRVVFDVKGYASSHWGGFLLRALVAIGLGLYCLLAPESVLSVLTGVVAIGLLVMGIFELVRAFMLHKRGQSFGLALISGGLETIFGTWLLVNKDARLEILAIIIAVIAIVHGLLNLTIAIKGTKDSGDRFIWLAAGILGLALGILIFFVPSFGWATNVAIIWIFGIFLLVMGLSNAFYAISLRKKAKKSHK